MFAKLVIKNFQSLREVELELGRITVIIGPSFLGKSAVVRALHALVHNRFNASYMTIGTKSTQIELHGENKWVRYNRGINTSYRFSDCPEAFTKMGREVPGEIKDFLNMEEIQFDQDLTLDFNIQKQFDPPFIIGLSGFEAAKVFGKMMNLDIVLSASRQISKDILDINKELNVKDAVIDATSAYLQNNYSIHTKNTLLKEALSLQAEIEKEEEELNVLFGLMGELRFREELEEHLEALVSLLDSCGLDSFELPPEHLEDLIVRQTQAEASITILSKIDLQVEIFDTTVFSLIESIIVSSDYINALYRSLGECYNSFEEIDEEIVDELNTLEDIISDGDNCNERYVSAQKDMRATLASLEKKEKDFDAFIKKNNICPLTKQPFSSACIAALKGGE